MRVRRYCLVFSLFVIVTLVTLMTWRPIPFITTSSARAWGLLNKQISNHNESIDDSNKFEESISGSFLRFFQAKLFQNLSGGSHKEENFHRMEGEHGKREEEVLNIPEFGNSRIEGHGRSAPMDRVANHDKWIVVTTVAPPTDDVKFLANISGWKVVVVGDTKTPNDWSNPNCIFLSVSKQLKLGLGIAELLPYKHYARKNVGYLYAIAHGAEAIYETDDDNRPLDKLTSFELQGFTSGMMYSSNYTTFNPYRHFGQPTLWPRGFPLSQIGVENRDIYKLSHSLPTPAIQQGVVNGDPDMDAVFRLTRKLTLKPLEVQFDPSAPPVFLPPGVFSPFNSQNTLFRKNALWALLIPTTTTFRMSDIWRGYWAQRLLWEIGGYIGFYPPNANQQRNAHDYMADMEDEKDMYFDTDKLLEFLSVWTCPESLTFFQCVYKLSMDMAAAGFWKEGDVTITRHWLEDLVRVGYEEPDRLNHTSVRDVQPLSPPKSDVEKMKALVTMQGTLVQFVASEQKSPEIIPNQAYNVSQISRQADMIAKLCPDLQSLMIPASSNHSLLPSFFHDILLIVIFNWPFYKNTRIMETIYRPIFPNIIYCGDNASQFAKDTASFSDRGLSFVEAPQIQAGKFSHWCVVKAMHMHYKVKGYLVTGDDDILNVWNFRSFDKNKVWMIEKRFIFNMNHPSWSWWIKPIGKKAYQTAMKALSSVAKLEDFKSPDNPVNTNDPKSNTQTKANHVERDVHNITARHLNTNDTGDPKNKNEEKSRINALLPENVTCRPSKFLARLLYNLREERNAIHAISDIYFIPERLKHDAIYYLTHFLAHKVFEEISVPTFFYGLENPEMMESFYGTNLWLKQRTDPWKKYNASNFFLHPVKMSQTKNLGPLCTVYLPTLLAQGYKNST